MKKAQLFLFFSAFVLQIFASENPMLFTKNTGQWDSRIYYIADLTIGKLLLERNQITFAVSDFSAYEMAHNTGTSHTVHEHIFRLKFEGANTESLVPSEVEEAYRNYYLGNNPANWRSNVPVYKKNTFKNLYAGIDLEVSGDETGFTYEYTIQPNANPRQIRQVYEGIDEVQIENGEIHYTTNISSVKEKNIAAYQIINGEKRAVECVIKKSGKNRVFFDFPNGYNHSQKLVIDPTIDFGTYTGSTADNWGYTATYDNNGSMYIGGLASNLLGGAYPTTTGAFQTTYGGGTGDGSANSGSGISYSCDMAITKYTPSGNALMYSTYLGGSDNETPNSLVVDGQGNLIIYGVAYSANYPVSAGAYDNSYNGSGDIVVTKFNASGSALLGSTFVGGTNSDGTNGPADEFTFGGLKFNYGDQNRGEVNIDVANDIYVGSITSSTNFPTTTGVYQTSNHGLQDGCIFKLNNNCSALLWSTYLGGANNDACYDLDIKANGEIYVCGGTMSSDFSTTSGVLHPTYLGGTYDGFISHISGDGSTLLQSTYIGTSGNDQTYLLQTDGIGDVYFVGQTTGAYPVVNAVYSNPNSGQFISSVNATLDTVRYSTVFGNGNGQPNISPTAFLVDTCKNVYVTGWGARAGTFGSYTTDINNMPLTSDAQQSSTDGTDFYHFVLAKNAVGILYGSYFGGNGTIEHVDGGTNRFDSRGIIYEAICAGCGG
ncbi:MAG TPA: hypothetical protein VGB95_02680, partial [Chitinophagales bacterium]